MSIIFRGIDVLERIIKDGVTGNYDNAFVLEKKN
jgi:hypothetical protein